MTRASALAPTRLLATQTNTGQDIVYCEAIVIRLVVTTVVGGHFPRSRPLAANPPSVVQVPSERSRLARIAAHFGWPRPQEWPMISRVANGLSRMCPRACRQEKETPEPAARQQAERRARSADGRTP